MKDEIMPDVPPVEAPPVNVKKASTQELKATPLGTSNVESVTRELLARDKKVMLKINSTERDKHAVFVGVNGRAFNIPRDTWVTVPAAVVKILENSKTMEYHVKADPKTAGERASLNPQEVSRFAFSVKPVETPAPSGKSEGK